MKAEKRMPSAEAIRECLNYDPDTGILTWRWRPDHHFASKASALRSNAKMADTIAGSGNGHGYRAVCVFGRKISSHRLAWIIVHGDLDDGTEVDHISGGRSDNRLVNLRAVSKSENHKNAKKPCTNTSGRIGVSWHKATGKWRASIKVHQCVMHLGVFDDLSAASEARRQAELKFGFHENHGRN
jgi:hypothetical protein